MASKGQKFKNYDNSANIKVVILEEYKLKKNIKEELENISQVIDNILNIKKFSKNVCKEFVDKIVIYNDKKFDFYLKGYDTSFNFNEESNISYLPHWL